jgi:hypothetical protein
MASLLVGLRWDGRRVRKVRKGAAMRAGSLAAAPHDMTAPERKKPGSVRARAESTLEEVEETNGARVVA